MAFAIFENVPLWHIDLFALPRIPIPSHQKMWEFKLKEALFILFSLQCENGNDNLNN